MRKGFNRYGSLISIISISIILLDQVAKRLVQTKMALFQSVPVIKNVLHITYIRNSGAAFGILRGKQGFFLFTTIIALVLIFSYIRELKENNTLSALALALILGGALGNFLDRVFYGFVVDFIEVKINFPLFNIADSAIVIGIILIFVESFFKKKIQNTDDENIVKED